MRYDRARVMKTAHAEWRAMRGRPGWDFARCLRLAWAVEKKRVAGPEYYQPDFKPKPAKRGRDFIWLSVFKPGNLPA